MSPFSIMSDYSLEFAKAAKIAKALMEFKNCIKDITEYSRKRNTAIDESFTLYKELVSLGVDMSKEYLSEADFLSKVDLLQ